METYDARVAACRFGVPARASCKLCGLAKEGVLDTAHAADLTVLGSNRCPSCAEVLRPEVLDVRRCGACGARAKLVDRSPPHDLRELETFAASLEAWAEREGLSGAAELVATTFVAEDLAALHRSYLRGEPLETVGDPFAIGGRSGGGGAPAEPSADAPPPSRNARRAPSIRVVPRIDTPSVAVPAPARIPELARAGAAPAEAPVPPRIEPAPVSLPPLSAPPRAILFPLVSVISADGEIHPEERAYVDAFLASEGMAPLTDDELRVYTPAEAARYVPRDRREKIVELMCEVAMVDGLADDAELRVVRAYASAWQIDEEKVETWLWGYEHAKASAARQFWLRIRRFVLSSRWESPSP